MFGEQKSVPSLVRIIPCVFVDLLQVYMFSHCPDERETRLLQRTVGPSDTTAGTEGPSAGTEGPSAGTEGPTAGTEGPSAGTKGPSAGTEPPPAGAESDAPADVAAQARSLGGDGGDGSGDGEQLVPQAV